MKLKKLPIGISTLRTIIEEDYLYIDKTKIALDLMTGDGRYFFLSRPRRFGKSLFLDTLRTIFDGDKEVFKGLYIYDKYEFEKHPVITLLLDVKFLILNELKENIINQLLENANKLDILLERSNVSDMFNKLIYQSFKKYNKRVVILIDDADKPFRDKLLDDNTKEIHRFLLNFYMVTKGNDEYIKFSFMTGIHPLNGDMLFGFNHFLDISIDKRYSTICGYTQNDVETSFKNHLVDVDMEKLKLWYNGYKFLGEGVYNPFDILLFIDNGCEYRNYWFSTATPSFLLKILEINNYFLPNLENVVKDEAMLNSFDVDYIELETLMWQTGYLTISDTIDTPKGIRYKLNIPNKEVRISLMGSIADFMSKIQNSVIVNDNIMYALMENNFIKLETNIKALFASIPYNLFTNNKMYEYEGYYVSVFYSYIKALGFELIGEDCTNKGRIDLTIKLDTAIYILEFKTNGSSALEQIKNKKYHEKYISENLPIFIVGIEFDKEDKNISKLEWEEIK